MLSVSARVRLIIASLAVLAVVFVGAAGYMMIEGEPDLTFFDAIYMTVITVSTVGYSEPWVISHAGRLWTMIIIAFGVVTVSYAFTSLVTVVVSDEFRFERERKRMTQSIDRLKNHVILCGYGRMGGLVAHELVRRGVPTVIVDASRELKEVLGDLDLPFIVGDATDEDVILQAGIMRAQAMVVALPSDADNVYVTLTAHTLRPELTIVARAEQPTTEAKLRRAGATRVVCPQAAGAMNVANILTRPTVVDFVELANKGVDLEIDEYQIGERSPLVGKTLRAAHVRGHTGAMVVAIKRADGEAIFSPDPDAVLASGDTLILVGQTGVSSRLDKVEIGS